MRASRSSSVRTSRRSRRSGGKTMLFAIIFLIAFVLLGLFALWLSKNVEHGEARFDTTGKAKKPDAKDATPARRIDDS